MPKLYRKANKNEKNCENLHGKMVFNGVPAKLIQPQKIILIPDLDIYQKQVNMLENRVNHMEQVNRRRAWRG